MQEPGITKVVDLTVSENQRVVYKSNLDDLNDLVRNFLFALPPTEAMQTDKTS